MLRVPYFALVAAALATPVFAQDSTVVVGGGPASSSVTVDMSVLDSLGPEPNVPDMMMGGRRSFVPSTPLGRRTQPMPADESQQAAPPRATGSVSLHPPRATKPRATAKAKPSRPKTEQTARATPAPSRAPSRAPSAPSVRPPAAAPPPPAVAVPSISPPTAAPPQQSASVAPPRSESDFTTPAGPIPATSAASEPPAPAASEPPAPAPAPAPAARPAPAPAPAPTSAPTPVSPPAQTAALPPAPSTGSAGQLTLSFAGEDATLNDAAKRQLDTVAARATKDESLRLQLLAYASGTGDAASRARRLSLSRALAVRSYLIDKGVRSTRIDVRALGNRLEGGGDPDRVDVIVGAR